MATEPRTDPPEAAAAAAPRNGAHAPAERVPVDRVTHPEAHDAGAPRRAHRDRAPAARRPVRDRRGARRRRGGRDRPRARRGRLPVLLRAPRRSAAQVRRGVHRPPGRRGQDLRGHAPGHRDAVRGAAARHRRGHERVARRGPRALRRRGRHARRRRHQAHRHHLHEPRRGAGRELPQDDGRDGHGHPGHPHQARRSPAQHAHDRRAAQAEADRQGQGDPGDLRADRASARHPRDQVGARGPRLRRAAPAQVPGDQGPGQPAARGARGLRPDQRHRAHARARRARHPRRDRRAGEALLFDLLEDDQEGPRVQRDLRPHGHAGHRRLGEGLLRRGRRHPLAVEAAARPLQGLHRDAEVQHVPVAAHDGDRARGAAARDPDPHARDARHGRVRRRRALDLQGGLARQARAAGRAEAQVAALDARLAAGAPGPQGVHGEPEGRPLRRGGLRLHAQGRGQVARRRAPRRWTSPTRSTPSSATAASARRSTARSSRSTTR